MDDMAAWRARRMAEMQAGAGGGGGGGGGGADGGAPDLGCIGLGIGGAPQDLDDLAARIL